MIYGKIGESTQHVRNKPLEGMVEMSGERPTVAHVADESGEWVLPGATADSVRAERDALIDKVSNEISRLWDNGGDYSVWQPYRQHLRDIPEQEGFPTSVDWGELPAEFTGK